MHFLKEIFMADKKAVPAVVEEPKKEKVVKKNEAAISAFTFAMLAFGFMFLGGFILIPFIFAIVSLVNVGKSKNEDKNFERAFRIVAFPVALVVLVLEAINIVSIIIGIVLIALFYVIPLILSLLGFVIYLIIVLFSVFLGLLSGVSEMAATAALLIL